MKIYKEGRLIILPILYIKEILSRCESLYLNISVVINQFYSWSETTIYIWIDTRLSKFSKTTNLQLIKKSTEDSMRFNNGAYIYILVHRAINLNQSRSYIDESYHFDAQESNQKRLFWFRIHNHPSEYIDRCY